jgi:hypothetical protein
MEAMMRVFYPISSRINELLDDDAQLPSGLMVVWSTFCIALLVLVLFFLPAFQDSAAVPHETLSNGQVNHAVHVKHSGSGTAQDSRQSYVDAHRCAQSFACATLLTPAAPTKPKAGADLYL